MHSSLWLLLPVLASLVGVSHAWRMGYGSRSVLPTVNGTTDYWTPVPDDDESSPGTCVVEWDVGTVAVGNGASESHWVRDDIRTYVAALEDVNGKIYVMTTTEVYMIFAPDVEEYYELIHEAVGDEMYAKMSFLTSAQHNHEGPDTSGLGSPINRQYFEYLLRQMRDAALDALNSLTAVILSYGSTKYHFGLGDNRDPRILDDSVHIIRAHRPGDTAPFVTIAQFAMHPEVTLGYQPEVPPEDCELLGREPGCSARGEFFTGDYPGIFRRVLQGTDGSHGVLYFNGAIGVQVGNWGPVWEITDEHPIGDGTTPPDGATIVPHNFRNAYLIGEQLALEVAKTVTRYAIEDAPVDFRSMSVLSRFTHPVFRTGLCASNDDENVPILIGYNMRELFTCEDEANPTEETCTSDRYRCSILPPMRVGNFAKTVVKYMKLGNVQIMSIPGELAPEFAIGVPADFDTPEGTAKYYEKPELHPVEEDYELLGTLAAMMNCSATGENMCLFLGLTEDEVGYMFPLCDWRLNCLSVADEEECYADYEKGAMDYFDSMSGESCEKIVRDFDAAEEEYTDLYGEETAKRVINTCKRGQLSYEDGEHYEETNSGSWTAAEDYIKVAAELLGTSPHGRYQLSKK